MVADVARAKLESVILGSSKHTDVYSSTQFFLKFDFISYLLLWKVGVMSWLTAESCLRLSVWAGHRTHPQLHFNLSGRWPFIPGCIFLPVITKDLFSPLIYLNNFLEVELTSNFGTEDIYLYFFCSSILLIILWPFSYVLWPLVRILTPRELTTALYFTMAMEILEVTFP